jgi:hypothetical protein
MKKSRYGPISPCKFHYDNASPCYPPVTTTMEGKVAYMHAAHRRHAGFHAFGSSYTSGVKLYATPPWIFGSQKELRILANIQY